MDEIDPRDYERNQSELDEILLELMSGELTDSESVGKLLRRLEKVYLDENSKRNGFRHNYSRATSAMFSPDLAPGDDAKRSYDYYAGKIQTLERNLSTLQEAAGDQCPVGMLMPLAKLHDHVNLELVRVNYNATINSLQDQRFGSLGEKVEESRKKTIEDIEEVSKDAQRKIEASRAETQKESVSVLGIFTGIVVAFVAGLTISSSVLQNIDKASIYRLAAMAVIIGLFMFDLLVALFIFLNKVTATDSKGLWKAFWIVNVVSIVLLALITIARFNLVLPPYF